MTNGKERPKRSSRRKELVDGFARKLALADNNHERSQLVRHLIDELRHIDEPAVLASDVDVIQELRPAAE